MSKIVVIDGGNIQFRAIFSYRNNTAVPCVYTYLSMLVGYLKRLNVTLEDTVIIAQDFGSWRKKIDKTYKAQRQDARESKEDKAWWEERYREFNALYDKLKIATPWQWIKIYEMESDDIGSVACRYYKDKEVILISSDRDWEQLAVYENVKIWSPITKKFKVIKDPTKILAEKIQGDISDNLLTKPTSELEFYKRKKIVSLLELPDWVENAIKEEFDKIVPKNLCLSKIPFNTIRDRIQKLYNA